MLTFGSDLLQLLRPLVLLSCARYALSFLAENSQTVLSFPFTHAPASLPHDNPTHSFWTHTPGANLLASEGSTGTLTDEADVCIIGSGITGVSAAYHLANAVSNPAFPLPAGKSQLRAVLLEARDFCSGATGRNGGNLTPYEFQHFREVRRRFGDEDSLKHYAIEHYSSTEMVRIAREAGWADEADIFEGGHIDAILTEELLAEVHADVDSAKAAGKNVNITWVDREEMNSTYGTYNWGIRSPGYNLWPLKFVNKLFLEANSTTRSLDLRLHTHTPVNQVVPLDSEFHPWALVTPRGPINCSRVLHATNGYASHLLPQLASSAGILPVRGQVIATRASVALSTITKISWAGNSGYWFPRPAPANTTGPENPLIILGGRREDAKPPYEVGTTDDSTLDATISKSLRAFLPTLFPRFYDPDTQPEMEWTGIMGYTPLDVPLVGRVPSRKHRAQYMSAGYAGHGMPRAYGCAEAVIGMMLADMREIVWIAPKWFPKSFLTRTGGVLT
ncbi:DAO domain-containing protein [Mycena indigotica]|uniref:Amine oxidase n=1 Tax=Mycena indigotica TaxID=2126181 RepID=A0A8H6T3A8_9AGAR|nr:DAO domain-containing protein [Mycena indigotica]KAF7310080.1 DAO domain-containing protein [Mycena indigotica]